MSRATHQGTAVSIESTAGDIVVEFGPSNTEEAYRFWQVINRDHVSVTVKGAPA